MIMKRDIETTPFRNIGQRVNLQRTMAPSGGIAHFTQMEKNSILTAY